MKIIGVGAECMGWVTAACLAETDQPEVCLDIDPRKTGMLPRREMPLHEPGLAAMVQCNAGAVGPGALQFIGRVRRPAQNGSAGLKYRSAAAENIGRPMTGAKVIGDTRALPVDSAEQGRAQVIDARVARGLDRVFAVVSRPEFLQDGAAVDAAMRPDRSGVGLDDAPASLFLQAVCPTPSAADWRVASEATKPRRPDFDPIQLTLKPPPIPHGRKRDDPLWRRESAIEHVGRGRATPAPALPGLAR